MVTWDKARQIVDQELRESWGAAFPELTFHVAEWGYADARVFQVPYGARESLVHEDPSALIVGEPVALVDRQTGELELVNYLDHQERLGGMGRVGVGHPEEPSS